MGREIRKVPPTWEHPKNELGLYVPMHEHFPYNAAEVAEGLANGWLSGAAPYYDVDVMPDWPAEMRTHIMMYETCSEGTPLSPAFETPEALARWLADNGASSFGSMTATYEQWLAVCQGGWAPSAVMDAKGFRSGVEAMPDLKEKEPDAE